MKETRKALAKQFQNNPQGYPEYEKYFKEFEKELAPIATDRPVEEEKEKSSKKVK